MRISRRFTASAVLTAALVGSSLGVLAQPAGASTAHPGQAAHQTLTAAQRQELRRLYAAYQHIPLADVLLPASQVQGATLRRTGEQFALANFTPAANAPLRIQVDFQDGAGSAFFARTPGQRWHLTGLAGAPLGCGASRRGVNLPQAVRTLWRIARCSVAKPVHPRPQPQVTGNGGTASVIADVATGELGVWDTPYTFSFSNSDDCNPYTAMLAIGTSSANCGTDPTHNILDETEFWCADFAKWVWEQAGVNTDLSTLNAGAKSFAQWGYDQGETITLDSGTPQVGDAVVLFPAAVTQTEINNALTDPSVYTLPTADHVGVVTEYDSSAGTMDVINGDYGNGTHGIGVLESTAVSPATYANNENTGDHYVFISPQLPMTTNAPAVGADGNGYTHVFWENASSGLEESFYNGTSWQGPNQISGMGPLGSQPSVAVASGGNQYVFWEGTGAQDLYEGFYNGTSWTGPNKVKDSSGNPMGPMASPPAAMIDSSGNEYVFWANSSGGLEETAYNATAGTWGGQHAISGITGVTSPSVAIDSSGNEYVFWENSTGGLEETAYNATAGTWGSQHAISGMTLDSMPTVGIDSSGNEYVFWTNSSGGLEETEYNNSAGTWGSQHAISGMSPLGSAPAVAVTSGGNQYVFWEGTLPDQNLYQASWTGSAWSGPTQRAAGPMG